LEKIAALTRDATKPGGGPGGYPQDVKTAAQRALYNNLGRDVGLALAVDAAIQASRMDGWRDNTMKTKRVRFSIKAVLEREREARKAEGFSGIEDTDDGYSLEAELTRIIELAKHQSDY
jgi:type I restriction enzyme, R subunit